MKVKVMCPGCSEPCEHGQAHEWDDVDCSAPGCPACGPATPAGSIWPKWLEAHGAAVIARVAEIRAQRAYESAADGRLYVCKDARECNLYCHGGHDKLHRGTQLCHEAIGRCPMCILADYHLCERYQSLGGEYCRDVQCVNHALHTFENPQDVGKYQVCPAGSMNRYRSEPGDCRFRHTEMMQTQESAAYIEALGLTDDDGQPLVADPLYETGLNMLHYGHAEAVHSDQAIALVSFALKCMREQTSCYYCGGKGECTCAQKTS